MRLPSKYPDLAGTLASDPEEFDRFDGAAARRWRRACGVSQYRLADLLGVARTTVARHERSAEAIPRQYALACAAAERLIRREHALERDKLRHRVAARKRRDRERRRQEAEAVASRSFWG